MKLKPIVASMFVLGLVSGPVMAAVPYDPNVLPAVDAERAKVAKMEAVIEQNQAGYFQQPMDWFNRITISGQANVDAELASRSPITFANGYASALILNNANIYVDALLNDWTTVHANFLYQDLSNGYFDFKSTRPLPVNSPTVDEGYVTIGNFARSPFYFRAGRQYVDFGNYNRYPMLASFTQVLSETSGTAATVGFVSPVGFNASAFLLNGAPRIGIGGDPVSFGVARNRVRNFGVNAKFCSSTDFFGYEIGVNYLRNMADVNYIANSIGSSYFNAVGGIGASADIWTGPFDASVRFVTAVQRFSPFEAADVSGGIVKNGAEPSAWTIDAGYSFQVLAHQSRFGLGYQGSSEAAAFFSPGSFGHLPQNRYLANYRVNISRWTDVGVEIWQDRDYSSSNAGTGTNATTGLLRLGVKFA